MYRLFLEGQTLLDSGYSLLDSSYSVVTSLRKGGYVFGSVCFGCLYVCEQHNWKSYEQIAMKFYW